MSSIYDIPTTLLFLMFVVVVVTFSVLGLYIFKMVDISPVICEDHNTIVAILIGVMSVFLGVMISFLIITAWGIYSSSQLDNQKEAQSIYILYEVVSTLPNTEEAQALIKAYLEYVINIEFPAMDDGEVPAAGEAFIQDLQTVLYDYIPEGAQETILYQRSIQLIDIVIDLRINRVTTATSGFNTLIWWMTIIDSILIIMMSWFLTCTNLFHYVVVAIIAIYVSSGLFTTIILSNPFRGSSALSAEPFEDVLSDIQQEYL